MWIFRLIWVCCSMRLLHSLIQIKINIHAISLRIRRYASLLMTRTIIDLQDNILCQMLSLIQINHWIFDQSHPAQMMNPATKRQEDSCQEGCTICFTMDSPCCSSPQSLHKLCAFKSKTVFHSKNLNLNAFACKCCKLWCVLKIFLWI